MADRPSKKRALLIGISYRGQPGELHGCANDVAGMLAACRRLSYDEVRVLCEPPLHDAQEPTRANILAGLCWLVEGAGPGDRLLLHYSGHGGQQAARAGSSAGSASSEEDGLDETIVPLDYAQAGVIIDNELRQQLVAPLYGTGAALRGVLDCCHSGTGLDLRYCVAARAARAAPRGGGLVATLVADAVRAELESWFGAAAVAERAPRGGLVATLVADCEFAERSRGAGPGAARAATAPNGEPDILVVSGCADSQTSADTAFGGRPCGALTHFFLAATGPAVRKNAGWPTIAGLLRALQAGLRPFGQDPQVSSETPIDGAAVFDLA